MVPKGRAAALLLTVGVLTAGLAACTASPPPSARPAPAGASTAAAPASAAGAGATAAAPRGTARVALPPGAALDYIWPFTPAAKATDANVKRFQALLYRPLYLFGGDGPSVAVNYPLSPAHAPVYSPDGKTVTITLKGWKWSNGETVDARDVVFWLNLMRAEPGRYAGYQPGLLPDNLASYRAADPGTVVLTLKSPVSPIWFTYNQLSEITPLPQAWDVTADGAKAGSGGCTADTAADQWARCKAVYAYLNAQASDTATYAGHPLWDVVDGPWRLARFTPAALAASAGAAATTATAPVASFAPNPAYSGQPKPHLAGLAYYAYPDDAAEYSALRAGRLDVGYVPTRNLAPVTDGQVLPSASPLGPAYTLSPDYRFAINYAVLNFNHPTLGPAFRQLYLRQVIQELTDQEGMVASVSRGYGYPTAGGVPARPVNQWSPAIQDSNGGQGPYAFSFRNAGNLLLDHGWTDTGGVMTCRSPGAGPGHCGAGVAAGTRLSLTLLYPAADPVLKQEAAILRADMARAGIQLTPVPQSPAALARQSAACRTARASCRWSILADRGWSFSPGYQPSGEALFATGGPANAGGYSDPQLDRLVGQTHTSVSLVASQNYAKYVAEALPSIWLPSPYTVAATSRKLANAAVSPLGAMFPEYWYFTGQA